MKFKQAMVLFPLAFAAFSVNAETKVESKPSTFTFSTEVSRTVEKDLIEVSLFSRKSGKNLAELKKQVSTNLNTVIDAIKKESGIEVQSAFNNYADSDNKGKVIGWVATGNLYLESKNIEAVAKILDNLGSEVGIDYISFKVSPEKRRALEDEMTLEIIKKFQHKAELIKKGLNAGNYRLDNVQLSTPNGESNDYQPRMYMGEAAMSAKSAGSVPLEAGKETISATASGDVVFE